MQQYRRAVVDGSAIATRHGKLARRDEEPRESFFDDPVDAELMAAARQDLLGAERRRFDVTVKGLEESLALAAAGPALPQAQFVDELRGTDLDTAVAEIGFDFATQRSTQIVWG